MKYSWRICRVYHGTCSFQSNNEKIRPDHVIDGKLKDNLNLDSMRTTALVICWYIYLHPAEY